jgi:hypothetical protein
MTISLPDASLLLFPRLVSDGDRKPAFLLLAGIRRSGGAQRFTQSITVTPAKNAAIVG